MSARARYYVVGLAGLVVFPAIWLSTSRLAAAPGAQVVSTTIAHPKNGTGFWPSIAIGSDGLPVIAHWDSTDNLLRVTHCGDVECLSSTTTAPAGETKGGRHAALVIGSDGLPLIAHWLMLRSPSVATLRVTHCGDVACTTADTVDVDSTDYIPFLGIEPIYTLDVAIGVDGLPLISYPRPSGLMAAHCDDRFCETFTRTEVYADAPVPDEYVRGSSVAIGRDGLPVIAYVSLASRRIVHVAHCSDATCAKATVRPQPESMKARRVDYVSLAIGSDEVPIVALSSIGGTFAALHCDDAECRTSSVASLWANPSNLGFDAAIAINGAGQPVISHFHRPWMTGGSELRLTTCADATCHSASTLTLDGPANPSGAASSIAVLGDGRPVIAHYSWQNSDPVALRVTACRTTTCQ